MKNTTEKAEEADWPPPEPSAGSHSRHAGEHHADVGLCLTQETPGVELSKKL